jgi:hypothetical protein
VKNSLKSKPPTLSVANPTYRDIITYQGEDRVYPNTDRSIARGKNIQYTIYVPCYDIYKQYYAVNRETMFANFSGPSDNGMTEDEIIAYIFLTDVEKLMYNAEVQTVNDQKSREVSEFMEVKPTLIERLINTYIAIERMTGRVSEVLSSSVSPIETAKYIIFPDDNTLTSSIAELDKYKKEIKSYYANYEEQIKTLSVTNDYTYYLMEIFAYMSELQDRTPGKDVDYIYERYVNQFISFKYNKQALISFLNLPFMLQNNNEVRKKFGITRKLLAFIKSHPLFALLYLGNQSTVSSKDSYHNVMAMILDLLSSRTQLQTRIYQIDKFNITEIEEVIEYVQKKVFELKEVIVSLHMLNIYFTHYRDSVVERDPISKVKISRDGFIEIYDQQNISPEFASFFERLFEPFKRDFLDGKIKAAWRKAFISKRFNPNLKNDKYNLSYWRDFNSFWVDFMGKKMDGMMKSWWKNFKDYTKPRKF